MTTTRHDVERFESIFEVHHRRVFGYALRRTASVPDAEDVVSETFAIACRRVADLPPIDRALPWLLAVARLVAANQNRSARRWRGLLDRLHSEPRPRPMPAAETPASEALSRLGSDDQELLRLLAWDELSQAEAGEVLGISANAVAIRMHRARRRFAAELSSIESDEMKGSTDSWTPMSVKGRLPGRSPREQAP